jgi:hypothetical protein
MNDGKFTDRAKKALEMAQEVSENLGHCYVEASISSWD